MKFQTYEKTPKFIVKPALAMTSASSTKMVHLTGEKIEYQLNAGMEPQRNPSAAVFNYLQKYLEKELMINIGRPSASSRQVASIRLPSGDSLSKTTWIY